MTKEERFDAVMQQLRSKRPVDFQIDAVGTFCMLAAMRLALQHPKFVGPINKIVKSIADGLTESLASGMPDLKEFLDELMNQPSPPDPASQQAVSE